MSDPICTICGRMCFSIFYQTQNKVFHRKCFRCSVCSIDLCQKPYLFQDGKFFCNDDAKAQLCFACKNSIEGDRVMTNVGIFHKDCFKCSNCSTFDASRKLYFTSELLLCCDCLSRKNILISKFSSGKTSEVAQRNELDLLKKPGNPIPKHFNEKLRTRLTAQFRAVERNIVISSQCENDLPKEFTESDSKLLEVLSLERENKMKDKENYISIGTSLNQPEFKTQTGEEMMKDEVQIERKNIGQPNLPASLSLNPLQQSPSNPNLEKQPSLIIEQTHIFTTEKPLNQTSNSTCNSDNISLSEQNDDTTLPEPHRDDGGKTSLDSTYTARRLSLSKLEELIVSKPELRSKLQTKSPNVNALIRAYEKMSQGRNSKKENSPEKKEEKTIRPNVRTQKDSTENQGSIGTNFVFCLILLILIYFKWPSELK
ncbi:unnamed protein product [Hymenolepis diminuta]|uniref:LIM zinc-binding domain-containing protein n=1 Tax=Hymenolepis diminuta TaxID=6216 RepID=A0A564Y510_HYMDI|nr:unnamed protein product [Hymenolepis diminuta]